MRLEKLLIIFTISIMVIALPLITTPVEAREITPRLSNTQYIYKYCTGNRNTLCFDQTYKYSNGTEIIVQLKITEAYNAIANIYRNGNVLIWSAPVYGNGYQNVINILANDLNGLQSGDTIRLTLCYQTDSTVTSYVSGSITY